MSERYPGGLITKTPVTPSGPYETSTASGIWTLDQQAYWRKLNQWPIAGSPVPDSQFNYVTMLLHGDGTNGAQNNTFLDSSTNNFTITRNGNTTQGSFSPYGSNWSNYFSGASGNYLSTSASNSAFDFSSTKTMTFECWFNASAIEPDNNLFGIAECEPFRFKITTSALVWEATSSGTTILSASQTWVKGTWYHVACVRNNDTLYMFINGTQVATTSYSTSWGATGTGYPVSIAANRTDTWFFNGYISNLRLVKGTAVYTSSFTPSTTPLTAISGTSLLTCQSNSFVDNSGNNIALTVNGTPSVQRFNPFGASTAYSTSVIGGSGYFDGTGDYLSVANNTNIDVGTGAFTIEAWVYRQGGSSDWRVMGGSVTGSGFFGGRADKLGLGRSNVAWDLESSTNVYNNNGWTHIVYVRDGSGNLSIFSNGVRVADTTGNSNDYGLNSGSLQVAAEKGSQTWIGYMSNFRLVKGSAIYSPTSTTLTVPTAPLTAVSGTGLLLYYTNGAIFDNAMMNDLETVGNAQISTSVVKYGTGSMYFDGTGDYLVGNGGQGLGGDFTIEAWVYAVAFTGDARVIVDTRDVWSTATGLNFYFNDTGNLIMYLNGGDRITSATAYSTSTWYFVTLARSGSTITMYVNGTSVGTYTYSTALTDKSITIGTAIDARNTGTGWHFNGYIDDLRITKGYARYTTTFTPPTQAFPNFGPT